MAHAWPVLFRTGDVSPGQKGFDMNKRDVVLSLLDGQTTRPYVPAAFFLHFPPAFRERQAAVEKHLEFFRYTDMDFVKIQYERTFPANPRIQKPTDWATMPRYDLDFFEGQLRAVEGLVKAAKRDAVVVVTLYSPFMCAGHATSLPTVKAHLEAEPEHVAKGLEIIADSLLRFVRECIQLGVDGFYASTQGGEAGSFSQPGIFEHYVKPYDLLVMQEFSSACPFNILHVCDYVADYADFTPFLDYPGQIVSSPLKLGDKALSPADAARFFARPWMGGLERKGTLASGTPDQVKEAARAVLASAPERFILGADCTVPDQTPWENLKAAIEAAHAHRPGSA
jgi:uroporphyrinogen decarboxylase